MSTSGSMDQFVACGLRTVKDQMKLRKLLLDVNQGMNAASTSSGTLILSPSSSGSSTSDGSNCSRKLSIKEIKQLSPEDKRIYLMTYVCVLCIFSHFPP